MTNSTSITGSRLKELRLAHNLKSAYLGGLLKVTYRNYLKYENGLITIDSEKLKFLAMFYGVSAYWILGLSTAKYESHMIEELERELFTKNEQNQLCIVCDIPDDNTSKSIQVFPSNDYIINPIYNKPKSRTCYRLPIRANIVFICHWIKDFFIKNPAYTTNLDFSFFKLDQDMIEFLISVRFLIKEKDLHSDIMKVDRSELSIPDRKDQIPLYNIDKTLADSEPSPE